MTESVPKQGARFALTIGLAAIFGGLWLFLDAQGVGVPQFKRLWPVLLLLAAGGALVDLFALSRRPSSAGWAVTWFGLGVLGLAVSLEYTDYAKILDWLPSFPTILGLAFLVTWLVDQRRDENLFIASLVLIGLGVLGFGARFDWLQKILPSAQVVWAFILVAGGGFLVWRAVAKK